MASEKRTGVLQAILVAIATAIRARPGRTGLVCLAALLVATGPSHGAEDPTVMQSQIRSAYAHEVVDRLSQLLFLEDYSPRSDFTISETIRGGAGAAMVLTSRSGVQAALPINPTRQHARTPAIEVARELMNMALEAGLLGPAGSIENGGRDRLVRF